MTLPAGDQTDTKGQHTPDSEHDDNQDNHDNQQQHDDNIDRKAKYDELEAKYEGQVKSNQYQQRKAKKKYEEKDDHAADLESRLKALEDEKATSEAKNKLRGELEAKYSNDVIAKMDELAQDSQLPLDVLAQEAQSIIDRGTAMGSVPPRSTPASIADSKEITMTDLSKLPQQEYNTIYDKIDKGEIKLIDDAPA